MWIEILGRISIVVVVRKVMYFTISHELELHGESFAVPRRRLRRWSVRRTGGIWCPAGATGLTVDASEL